VDLYQRFMLKFWEDGCRSGRDRPDEQGQALGNFTSSVAAEAYMAVLLSNSTSLEQLDAATMSSLQPEVIHLQLQRRSNAADSGGRAKRGLHRLTSALAEIVV
jgi:hypothetical protein